MTGENLFQHVLMDPARRSDGRKLLVVSGYASAGMADMHMECLRKEEIDASIALIVGMTVGQRITEAQHMGFRKLATHFKDKFSCRYVTEGVPVHAKSYVWLDHRGVPVSSFCGSANYTLTGFGENQVERMSAVDPLEAHRFYQEVLKRTSNCLQVEVEEGHDFIEKSEVRIILPKGRIEQRTLSLLDSRTGETPKKSGINWGQRKGRDKNQAYIQIPTEVGQSGFFPERGERFVVHTDNGRSLICVRAQVGGKGLHTTLDNSELGAYFRRRLGLNSGEYVHKEHLERYGRTDVTFSKIDDETYLMDFRPPSQASVILHQLRQSPPEQFDL